MSIHTTIHDGYGKILSVRTLLALVLITTSFATMAASKLQLEGLDRMRGFLSAGAFHQAIQEARFIQKQGMNQLTTEEQADLYRKLGYSFAETSQFDSAELYFIQSIELYIDQNDFVNLSKAYSGLGSSFERKGDYSKAMTHFITALGYAERQSDRLAEIIVKNNLATLQRELGQLEDAKKSYQEALDLMTADVHRRQPAMKALLNSNLSTVFILESKPDSAEYHIQLAEDLRPEKSELLAGYNQLRLGKVYLLQDAYQRSELALKRALELFSMTDHSTMKVEANNAMGALYIRMEHFGSARELLNTNLSMAYALESPLLKREAHRLLALIYEQQGDYQSALLHSTAYQKIENSLMDAKAKANVEALQQRIDAQNARKQVELLRQEAIIEMHEYENRRNLMVSGLLALAIITLLVILLYRRTKRSNKQLSVTHQRLEQSNKLLQKHREQLERLLRDKNRILSVLAHDIRSPLAAYSTIPPMLEVLLEHKKYERIYDVAEGMEKSTEKLNLLVNNLLEWALSQEHGQHQIVEAEIPSLIKECIEFADDYLKEKKLDLDIVIEGDLKAKMDVNAFKTVFRNLVSNAAKYSDSGMPIAIRGVKEDNLIKLSVIDQGMGMDEDTLKSLFDINRPKKKSNNGNHEGLGLAMILCKEIIDLNQWEIEVESAPGKGSVFTLLLPLEAA